jgi:hypothetical protein
LELENGNLMKLENIAGCVSDTDIPSRPQGRSSFLKKRREADNYQ